MAAPDANAPQKTIRLLTSVAELVGEYDGYVLDLWGVIHDGIRPYPGATNCLRHLKEQGARIVLLSNAPRRADAVIAGMGAMGIPRSLYDHVLSSGEATWLALKARSDPWHARLGRRCLHLGPERDKGLLEGLDLILAATPAEAEFILNTGVDRDEETVEDYEAILADGARRGLPMLCANPDLEVIRGGRRVICAGSLAARYAALGGEVAYHGKPHPAIYHLCHALIAGIDRTRVVAIGDSLRTDIAGGQAAGLDTVFVTGGIHAEELGLVPGAKPDSAALYEACRRAGRIPNAALAAFTW
jgi:HAD superfamily hydrolase (TIGR01459 family)